MLEIWYIYSSPITAVKSESCVSAKENQPISYNVFESKAHLHYMHIDLSFKVKGIIFIRISIEFI